MKKSWWKKSPYWIKGGIISILIQGGLFLIVTLLLLFLVDVSDIFFGIGALLALLVLSPAMIIGKLGIEDDLFGMIFSIVIYFLIGALIGLIVGKVKKKES